MSGILPFRLSIKARLRCQQHIRQAQSLAEKPLPSICTFLGSPEKYFFDKLSGILPLTGAAETVPFLLIFSKMKGKNHGNK